MNQPKEVSIEDFQNFLEVGTMSLLAFIYTIKLITLLTNLVYVCVYITLSMKCTNITL